jgi:UDP-N-acetylmuramate-alanine ligase
MKTLLTAVVATIGLSALSCHAFESTITVAGSDMQRYVFTYNFNKQVDPLARQYKETSQTLDYALALDIQGQVYNNLNAIVVANSSRVAMRSNLANSQLSLSE